ncbi:3-oxoacyl-ACP reductase [Solibacillus sp. A46]|uniref:3-oxoacyl-ACP reductase n=1 Tax=Solibacillus faecavium TaxID=2762221 RepID=A0ABR8Y270_9BACL|nr:3-oxoacyl-ACP reductase [Solibacillus faecavium]MBD8038302.1 3-oxoacyl-ACP reductase [Solibacillus faecavium]
MAKLKGKGVVMAGLIAGAASFLSKKENRDKAMDYLNKAKGKVDESGGVQGLMQKAQEKVTGNDAAHSPVTKDLNTNIAKSASVGKDAYEEETLEEVAMTAGDVADHTLEGNQMVEEGAQTTTDYYNDEQDKRSK